MKEDLTIRMQQWREGLLSDVEILGYLYNAQLEVLLTMEKAEVADAEKRFANHASL